VKPRILALDTTTEFGSIALIEGDGLVSELEMRTTEGFSRVLFGHVETILRNSGWALDEVACFAAAAGPGSFTGVRVGLAAVKGLAEALGKPVVAVSNLQAMAWFGSAPLRATVLDARRDQVYAAVYGASLQVLSPEVVTSLAGWLEGLPEGEIEFLATDFGPYRAAFQGTRFERAPLREVPRALAGAIGRIAAQECRAGRAQDPAAIDANYVRRSDAELFWKET
jgi:tRNA threonylcarbamoyladenosine biosynthesis protein TsaB